MYRTIETIKFVSSWPMPLSRFDKRVHETRDTDRFDSQR